MAHGLLWLQCVEDAEGDEDAEAPSAEAETAMMIDQLSFQIIGAAMVVHTELGAGLSEKSYDDCFGDQLSRLGLQFDRQVRFPVMWHGRRLQSTFRVDYVVKKTVIVEIKAVQSIHPVHVAQLRSYLKMSGLTLGLMIKFNVVHLRDRIKRVVNGYVSNTEV